ncbi:putative glutathione S-transferase [Clavispora lusitaniae]|nr:hypothetical protein E0198_002119 [Clavispora lusitaniae]KAF7579622.1 Glutathione S-transferase, C-terminal domain family protein [Clavispora lusitaniae]OVF07636.1 putative bifunctional glutathione transferase/peroxidase [Clavispora lusitaniae]QFZ27165.1 putative glutathione S-transferase [Clavispora lusitaniae]QFZ33527.1 putative glutathione S-transferase [Clavispora lusitaniae]
MASETQDKFLLHHLNYSRSSRIIWILEELKLNYEIKYYKRTKEFLAPKELRDVFPTGTAPILQVFKAGREEPITLAESGHIIQYLIQHYDPEGKLSGETEDEKELIDYYLHFAEGSLQPHLVSMLIGKVAVSKTPWPLQLLTKTITGKMNDSYYFKRLSTNLRLLDDRLAKKGGGYFVGNKLTAADIILDFPINENIFGSDTRLEGVDFKTEYPNLYKWHQLTTKEPLHVTAVEKSKL